MMYNKVIIEQTLHGYSNGHHLLASSINLSENSKLKMEILSDLSGPEIQNGFRDYYTGYFLPDDNMAVLSHTWYADEMERPGCVWTHSLLINPNDLSKISNSINQLIGKFNRPSNLNEYINYTNQIKIEMQSEKKEFNTNKLQYLVWAIWGNESPSIIQADTSNEYANEIIYLWTKQYRDLEQGFTFSTGSLAIRKYNKEIFSLQVVPKRIINNVLKIDNKCKVLKDINEIKAFPVWVSKACFLLLKDSWEDLNRFREKFGVQYLQSKYLSQFVKVYIGAKADTFCLNVRDGLNIIEKVFSPIEKENLGNLLINLYIDNKISDWIGNYENSITTLVYLVENNWLSISNSQLEKLICHALLTDRLNSKKMVKYLSKKEASNLCEEILKIYANSLEIDAFDDFTDMELDMCSLLVTLNPDLAKNTKIWQQSLEFQLEIISCIKRQIKRVDLSDDLLTIILDNSVYDFGEDLYEIFGEKSINVFLDYIIGFRLLATKKSNSIKEVCKKHPKQSSHLLETRYNELNMHQLILMFEITNPYSNCILMINQKKLIQIFDKIRIYELTEDDKLKVALFYLPIILRLDIQFPTNIVKFAFETVHSCLAKQALSYTEWQKLDKLLPEVSWFNQWDKCKRLRKAIKRKGYNLIYMEDNEDTNNDTFLF